MNILWDADGWVTPGDLRAGLSRPVAMSTVSTVLTRLVEKGRVERRPARRGFEYHARVGREEHIADQMRGILDIARDRNLALMRFVDQLPSVERSRLRSWLWRRQG